MFTQSKSDFVIGKTLRDEINKRYNVKVGWSFNKMFLYHEFSFNNQIYRITSDLIEYSNFDLVKYIAESLGL